MVVSELDGASSSGRSLKSLLLPTASGRGHDVMSGAGLLNRAHAHSSGLEASDGETDSPRQAVLSSGGVESTGRLSGSTLRGREGVNLNATLASSPATRRPMGALLKKPATRTSR